MQLHVETPFRGLDLGESVAVSGVCLTVTAETDQGFWADVSAETCRATTLGSLDTGARVNLERALAVGERLGGHIVSGHVDGLCSVTEVRPSGSSRRVRFRAPEELMALIAPKGSICLDGVSLTVNGVTGCQFDVMMVPHTLEHTTLAQLRPAAKLNLEVDVLARYVQRCLSLADASQPPKSPL